MNSLRILLVDDHLLFRKGLARLLDAQPDFEVIGEARDGLEAVEQAASLHPDLVLMDIRMPNCDGLEATRRIKAQMPEVRVVMLTVSDDERDLVTAVRYGADGYLLKDLLPEVLFQQLRGLASGEAPMSRAMTGKLFRQLAQQGQPAVQPAASILLSARECQVLALVVGGCSNQEIAGELGITRNTVKNHLRRILAKLGVRNRAQAAAYAVSHGLVCLPTDNSGSTSGNKD
ncbi:MAG: response regulator transcription factor [Chloroflexota bacterium]|nr:response regulator transcription factor [Chloroflexota bacterium]